MSDARVYVDEDAAENAVVLGLRGRGIDVLTTMEAGRCGTHDHEQLAFASQQGRSIYTFNARDVSRLHSDCLKSGEGHAGIIVLPDQRCSIGEKFRRLTGFLSRVTTEEMVDRMNIFEAFHAAANRDNVDEAAFEGCLPAAAYRAWPPMRSNAACYPMVPRSSCGTLLFQPRRRELAGRWERPPVS